MNRRINPIEFGLGFAERQPGKRGVTAVTRINPDRVRKMLKAERRRRGEDSNYYGPHTPIYHVAQRFKITCAEVRKIARGRLHDQETPEG